MYNTQFCCFIIMIYMIYKMNMGWFIWGKDDLGRKRIIKFRWAGTGLFDWNKNIWIIPVLFFACFCFGIIVVDIFIQNKTISLSLKTKNHSSLGDVSSLHITFYENTIEIKSIKVYFISVIEFVFVLSEDKLCLKYSMIRDGTNSQSFYDSTRQSSQTLMTI